MAKATVEGERRHRSTSRSRRRKEPKNQLVGGQDAQETEPVEGDALLEPRRHGAQDGVANVQVTAGTSSPLLVRPQSPEHEPSRAAVKQPTRLGRLISGSDQQASHDSISQHRHRRKQSSDLQPSPSSRWWCTRAHGSSPSLSAISDALASLACLNGLGPLRDPSSMPPITPSDTSKIPRDGHLGLWIEQTSDLPYGSAYARPRVYMHVVDLCTGRSLQPMQRTSPASFCPTSANAFQWHCRLHVELPWAAFLSPRVVLLLEIAQRKEPRRRRRPSPRRGSPRRRSLADADEEDDEHGGGNGPHDRTRFRRLGWCFFRPVSDRGTLMIPESVLSGAPAAFVHGAALRLQLFQYQRLGWLDEQRARTRWQWDPHDNSLERVPTVLLQFQLRRRLRLQSSSLAVGLVRVRSDAPIAPTASPQPPLQSPTESASAAASTAYHKDPGDSLNNDESCGGNGDNQEPPSSTEGGGVESLSPSSAVESSSGPLTMPREDDADAPLLVCKREALEPCLLPHRLLHRLSTAGPKGTSCLAFSPDGVFLAAAMGSGEDWCVRVHEVNSGALWQVCGGHRGMIYSVEWRQPQRTTLPELLTASADGTVRLWRLRSTRDARPMLVPVQATVTWPHTPGPVFVYAAMFHPRDPQIVLSGASDGRIRVWDAPLGLTGSNGANASSPSGVALLCEWIGGTKSDVAVHALCIEPTTGRLFCGDAHGAITVWQPTTPAAIVGPYELVRTLRHGPGHRAITSLHVHPRKQRLLVLAHPHALLQYELRSYLLLQRGYAGVDCSRQLVRAAFSPDGRFVVSGSEDGTPLLFGSARGERIEDGLWGRRFFHGQPILGIAWSPTAHIAAMAASGSGFHPIVILGARRDDPRYQPEEDPENPAQRSRWGLAVGNDSSSRVPSGMVMAGETGQDRLLDATSVTSTTSDRVQRALERRRQRLLRATAGTTIEASGSPDSDRIAHAQPPQQQSEKIG